MQTIITLWPRESYGDQARAEILPLSEAHYVETNADIVRRVIEQGAIGIIPVSNPYGGEVWESWSAIEENRSSLVIAGSHTLPLDHALIQRHEHVWSEIRRIFSHPQAYAQSKPFLDRHYPLHSFTSSQSTTRALPMISLDSDAAIVSAKVIRNIPELSRKYQIVQEDISPSDNATKFVVIATKESVWEVTNLPPSEVDLLRVALENKPLQFALKLLAIGQIGGNIHEWSKAKANPWISSLYSALLITSRLPRETCTPAWFETMGIEPIMQKEDLW